MTGRDRRCVFLLDQLQLNDRLRLRVGVDTNDRSGYRLAMLFELPGNWLFCILCGSCCLLPPSRCSVGLARRVRALPSNCMQGHVVGFRFVAHCLFSTVAIDLEREWCNAHPPACLYPGPTCYLLTSSLSAPCQSPSSSRSWARRSTPVTGCHPLKPRRLIGLLGNVEQIA